MPIDKIDTGDTAWMLAATALVHNLIVISRNVSDFKNITGLEVIDPHSL